MLLGTCPQSGGDPHARQDSPECARSSATAPGTSVLTFVTGRIVSRETAQSGGTGSRLGRGHRPLPANREAAMQCCLRAWGGAWFLFLCAVVSLGPAPPCEAKATSLLRLTFHREVVNLEGFAGRLTPFPPEGLKNGPVAEGDLWFGSILRRLPDDDPTSREHDAFFAVQFQGLSPVRAWCDTNLDGDLSNDALIPLSVFPDKKPARSFLSDLRWTAARSGKKFQADRLVRVILEFPD